MKRFALVFTWMLATTATADEDRAGRWVVPLPERPELALTIRSALAEHAAVSDFPLPDLDEERLAELYEGDVVRIREKWDLPPAPDARGDEEPIQRNRVVAFHLVERPRDEVWLAALDPHFLSVDGLTELRLGHSANGTSTWYQFLDLPWPVRNRHWVIRVRLGLDVAEATSGRAWEQSWRLKPDARLISYDLASSKRIADLTLDDVREARYMTENTGAWIVFDLGGGRTLLAYELTIVLGGWIPDGLAARFAMSTLETLLTNVARTAEEIPAHYDAEHEPILGGDGQAVRLGPPLARHESTD